MTRGIRSLVPVLVATGMFTAFALNAGADGGGAKIKHVEEGPVELFNGETASIKAKCSSGYKVVAGGVGAPAVDFLNRAQVIGLRPADGSDARSRGDDAWVGRITWFAAGTGDATAYATCSRHGLARGLIYRKKAVSEVAPGSLGKATAKCPTRSKVVGGGVFTRILAPIVSRPKDGPDSGSKADDAWQGAADNIGSDEARMTVYAVCSRGKLKRGLEYRKASVMLDDSSPTSLGGATANCPQGSKVLGGGIGSAADSGEVSTSSIRPERRSGFEREARRRLDGPRSQLRRGKPAQVHDVRDLPLIRHTLGTARAPGARRPGPASAHAPCGYEPRRAAAVWSVR